MLRRFGVDRPPPLPLYSNRGVFGGLQHTLVGPLEDHPLLAVLYSITLTLGMYCLLLLLE